MLEIISPSGLRIIKMGRLDTMLKAAFAQNKTWDSTSTYTTRGLIMELGVGHGDSFNKLCQENMPRTCYGFDWFRGLPESWCAKPGGHDLKLEAGTFNRDGEPPKIGPNGQLVIGLVEDTLEPFLKERGELIARVDLDMDLYKPTTHALRIMTPYFQVGTIIYFDEINEAAGIEHEQKAFREWLETVKWDLEYLGGRSQYSAAFRLW